MQATWGLVAATALLVVAATIPLPRDAADRRERQRRISAQLVRDMNILRSRLEGARDCLADGRSLSDDTIKFQLGEANGELKIIGKLIEAPNRPSLLFVNETYLVQHFLTQARIELRRAHSLANESTADAVRTRDDALLRARRVYKAAINKSRCC